MLGLIQIQEVVTLQQLIGKLSERQAVASLTIQSFLNRILCHHVIHGDVLTHLTSEIQESEIFHPVVVVHHFSSIGLLTLKVQKLSHLLLDALLVVIQRLGIQQVSLLTFARWVANHTCCTTHQDDGLVSATLEVSEHHNAAQVTDMQ